MWPDRRPTAPAGAGEERGGSIAAAGFLPRRALLASLLAATLPACAAAGRGAPLATAFALPDLPAGSPLRPLGGLEIDRAVLGFGGLSGLHLAPDLTLTAVSDLARFAEFTLSLDAGLRPRGLSLRRSGHLGDGAGRPLPRGFAGDAEALARLPDGRWLVAFERWHRIRAHRDLAGPAAYVEAPPGLERAPANGGLEALAVLADGRLLALSEDLPMADAPGVSVGWVGGPGAWRAVGYRPAPGFAAVDAAGLPDGGALVLERAFSFFTGFAGRLCRLPTAALRDPAPGAVLEGEEVLRLVPPLPVDNYEGVAVAAHAGRRLVALLSDDNENRLQRTLLLLFEWVG
ncbi:esterase-like activity of phytase family protein [Falsiroseomonas sp. CW058]|uniref:esterase-like activity of phytase family protein n=1 Tax=Falsiroseomonas sp. CW058 TaxID=3388664 RepID=UPI003D31416B